MLQVQTTRAVASLAGSTTANVRTPCIQRQRCGRRSLSRVVPLQGFEAGFRPCMSTASVEDHRPALGSRGTLCSRGRIPRCRLANSAYLKLQAVQGSVSGTTTHKAEYIHTIPVSTSLPADAVAQAQAAAEAEQQKLLTTGLLADEISRGNKELQAILNTYSTLQRLYHKAVLPLVKHHGQLAVSNVGLAYSIYCQLLRRRPDKQPGDKLSSAELRMLSNSVKSFGGCQQNQHLTQFADYLCQLDDNVFSIHLFVMPDIVWFLLAGFLNDAAAVDAASRVFADLILGGNHIAGGLVKNLTSASVGGVFHYSTSRVKPLIIHVLLAMCQPASKPPTPAIAECGLHCILEHSLRSITEMHSILDGAMCLLQPSDQQELLQASSELYRLLASTHSNVYMTVATRHTAGTVVQWATASCAFTYWAAVMHKTAAEQLAGSRAIQDWGPVQEALILSTTFMSSAGEAWLTTQKKLASSAAHTSAMSVEQLTGELNSMSAAMGPGGFWAVTASAVGLDMLRASSVLRSAQAGSQYVRQQVLRQSQVFVTHACKSFLAMIIDGMTGVLDAHYSCWSSLWYWMSLVTLSLQKTGGKQGPEAVAVAEQLMKEKHSVFLAKLCLQVVNAQLQAKTARNNDELISACQLPNHPDLDLLITARGEPSRVAALHAFKHTSPAVWPATVSDLYKQAASMFACDGRSNTSDTWNQALSKLLLTDTTPSQAVSTSKLARAFANAPVTAVADIAEAGSQPVDNALSSAYGSWLEQVGGEDLATDTAVTDHIWFIAGLAQHHIYTHSSSKEVAELMLGPGATEEQHVRPIGEFLQRKAATVVAVHEHIARKGKGGGMSCRAAATLLLSRIPSHAPISKQMIDSITWLTAAALSSPDSRGSEFLLPVAHSALTSAYRIHNLSATSPPDMYVVLKTMDAMFDSTTDYEKEHIIAGEILWTLVCGSPPLHQLQPPAQALLQCAVTRWLGKLPGLKELSDVQLEIIARVPLLHAGVYTALLNRASRLGNRSHLFTVWSAAISASTDLQLSGTPAFGGQRPNEQWLVQQLELVICPLLLIGETLLLTQKTPTRLIHQIELWSCQMELLLPVLQAVQQLLYSSPKTAAAAAAGSSSVAVPPPSGWLLLNSLCGVTAAFKSPSTLSKHLLCCVIELTAAHQHLDRPPFLLPALCAAAVDDVSIYHLAVQQAKLLKLTADDVQSIRSAAVQGAATAASAATPQHSPEVLLQLWSDMLDALQAAPAADSGLESVALQPPAAAAVASCLSSCDELADKLLMRQLPVLLLIDLMKAAVSEQDVKLLQLLLKHARQHDKLQQLLGRMSHDARCQVLMLLSNSNSSSSKFTETCLIHSWEVYLLLQSEALLASKAVPSDVLSALLQQQGTAGHTDRVLQVWIYMSQTSSDTVHQLTPAAQTIVLSALVESDQQQKAVDLVKQVPEQLGQLVTLWQQQQQLEGRPVAANIMMQALQIAISRSDADAAEGLLWLLQQDKQRNGAVIADSHTAIQLVQLLSIYERQQAAMIVLETCLLSDDQLQAETAAPALASYITAITALAHQQQQEELVQLLGAAQQSKMEGLLSETLNKLLLEADSAPAVVAMVLWLLASSSGKDSQQLPSLLTSSQFEQLCILVSKQGYESSSNSSSSQPPTTLPTAAALAQQCIESNADISHTAAVTLINSMAAAESDLQPARAVEICQVMHTDLDDATAALADKGSLLKTHICRNSWMIAQLCYQQLLGNSSSNSSSSSTMSGFKAASAGLSLSLSWVPCLTPEAAAAALFAAWYWAQASAEESAMHPYISLTVRPPVAAAAANLLCLELYQAARSHSRPKLNSLLLDLGLTAAAAAQQWEQGAAIISTAERALAAVHSDSSASKGSKSSFSTAHWVPLLPAALTALPAVMVHTQGVARTAELLMREHEQQQLQQQEQPSVRRKGKSVVATAAVVSSTTSCHSLLSPACISSFLSASVGVATAAAASADDDAAKLVASDAVKVAHALYGQQLVSAQLTATRGGSTVTSSSTGSRSGASCSDTSIYSSLLQLYGLTDQLQQVADITMAAVHGQLRPLDNSGSSSNNANSADSATSAGDALQQVLAGSAAALLSAGAAAVVFDLLDGLTAAAVNQVTDRQLVERMMQAADVVDEKEVQQALSSRVSGGSESAEIFMLCSNPDEVLQELGGGGGDGDGDASNDKDNGSTSSLKQVYLRLVARNGLEPSALTQQLQQRLKQAVQ